MLYFPSFMSQRGTYSASSSSPTASPSLAAAAAAASSTSGAASNEEMNLICYQQPDQLGRNSYHVLHKLVHPPALGAESADFPAPSYHPHLVGGHHHHPAHRQQQQQPTHQRLTLAPAGGAFAALDGLVLPESGVFRSHPATTASSPTTAASAPTMCFPGVAGTNHLYAAAMRHQQQQQQQQQARPSGAPEPRAALPSSSSCSSASPKAESRRQGRRKRYRAGQGSGTSSPTAGPTWQRRQGSQTQSSPRQRRPQFTLGPPTASSDEPSPSGAAQAAAPAAPAAPSTGAVKCSVHCRAEGPGMGADAFCSRSSAAMPPCPDSPPDHDCAKMGCERVTLNVSGMYFETRRGILDRHPETLLGNSGKRKPYFDAERKEYFFDRHRPTFEAIFNYYQYGGKIKRPNNVPDDIFLSELEFYEIEKEVIDTYKRDEGYVIENVVLPDNPFKRRVWMLFEYPETSTTAFFIAVSSVIFTVISIILFCVETLPVFATSHCVSGEAPNFLDPFFIVESMCTFWFTLEVIVRFFVCPSVRAYVKDLKNAVDVAAIVPYYVTLFNVLLSFSCEGAKGSASLAFLRVIRLIRVFKLTKHSAGLQVLVLTFRASIEGLSLFLVALIVCILVFSSTIYYVEADNKNSHIESIPDAFWWAIITMCTVGYGDKVPKGPLGKLVGGCCALAGVLTLAIPVPIITENFNKFYTHKTGRGKH